MSLNLTAAGLADQKAWEAGGYALPSYDREAMITRTKESPCWVHFGAGNIFRAFQANTAQELLNNGTFDRGVIVAANVSIILLNFTNTKPSPSHFNAWKEMFGIIICTTISYSSPFAIFFQSLSNNHMQTVPVLH